jgi:hypothetical protein
MDLTTAEIVYYTILGVFVCGGIYGGFIAPFIDARREKICPKCKRKSVQKTKLVDPDFFLPDGHNVIENFKCSECGHAWHRLSKYSKTDS